MRRVLLTLMLCLAGGASTANAGECYGGHCRYGYSRAARDYCVDAGNERGERCCRPVRRVLSARPVRKLFANRTVRHFLFSRCCG
jgi:hypothetical protein